MARSIWDLLNGQFSAGVPWANKASDVGSNIVKGVLDSTIDAVKTPGNMMTPNPHPPGSEEADFYDRKKSEKATDWGPEMALNTMGTGGIMGVPVKGAEAAFGSGILRKKKEPPLIPLLHGTGSPDDFVNLKPPPATHDAGIHAVVPHAKDIPDDYAFKHGSDINKWPYVAEPGRAPKVDFMSGMRFDDPNAAGPRVKPYLGDFQNSLRFPLDAGKFNNPGNVINSLEQAMRKGFVAPRGLLEDMYNISKPKDWETQFVPMLESRGYDSMLYPHAGSQFPDTFMGFKESQFIPRFSPEGMKLAEERGIAKVFGNKQIWTPEGTAPQNNNWVVPKSVIHKPAEFETLTKNPKTNTAKWWDESAPDTKIKQLGKEYDELKITEAADKKESAAKYKAWSKEYDQSQKKLEPYKKAYEKGEMTKQEYQQMHDSIMVGSDGAKFTSGGTAPAPAPFSTKIKSFEDLDNFKGLSTPVLYKLYEKGEISKWEFHKLHDKDALWDYHNMKHHEKQAESTKIWKAYDDGTLTENQLQEATDALWGKKKIQVAEPSVTEIDNIVKQNHPKMYKELDSGVFSGKITTEEYNKAMAQLAEPYLKATAPKGVLSQSSMENTLKELQAAGATLDSGGMVGFPAYTASGPDIAKAVAYNKQAYADKWGPPKGVLTPEAGGDMNAATLQKIKSDKAIKEMDEALKEYEKVIKNTKK